MKNICGVPLGGVGTGKFEICPDGAIHHLTINNNDVFPIDGMEGTFFMLALRGEKPAVKVLQTSSEMLPSSVLLQPGEIKYRGLYPRCIVDYEVKELPLRISLHAFSPIVPKRPDLLCLPLAYMIFDVENLSGRKIEGSLAVSWEDVNGCWGSKVSWDSFVPPTEPHFSEDRGFIEVTDASDRCRCVTFRHRERHPEVADFAYGDYTLAVDSTFAKFAYQYDPSNRRSVSRVLDGLSTKGWLDDTVTNEKGCTAALLGSKFTLWPGERARILFALAWYTPDRWGFGKGDIQSRIATPYDHAGKKIGHWYSNYYSSSLDVIERNLGRAEEYLSEVLRWQEPILESTLPEWLKEMLINQNYLLSSNMTWAKDGRFTILESPNCPCLGTLDQRFYGSPMTLIFCPELDHRELVMYAEFSDRMYEKLGKYKGQIYHDFGNNRIDYLNIYGYNWLDLNVKFVLLCWRNYLYTGKLDDLKELYYKMKEAMERELSLDHDGDYLPEGWGNCNTYEGHFFGANSYDGGLWLAALKVFPKVARLMGDEQAAAKYEKIFREARKSFEEKLWMEDRGHYAMCTESKDTRTEEEIREEDQRYLKRDENPDKGQCRDDQLVGSWYSMFLNEGLVNDPVRTRRALTRMIQLLATPVSEDGILVRQSERVNQNWPGYNVAHFASLAIQMGEVETGLSAVKGIYDLIYRKYGLIWNQPIGLSPDSRPRGDRYMNSGSIWHVLWALQGFFVDVQSGTLAFRPNIPAEWRGAFVTPIFTGGFSGRARYSERIGEGLEVELELSLDRHFEVRRLILKAGGFKEIREIEIYGAEVDFESFIGDDGDLVLEFSTPMRIGPGSPVTIRYALE